MAAFSSGGLPCLCILTRPALVCLDATVRGSGEICSGRMRFGPHTFPADPAACLASPTGVAAHGRWDMARRGTPHARHVWSPARGCVIAVRDVAPGPAWSRYDTSTFMSVHEGFGVAAPSQRHQSRSPHHHIHELPGPAH